MRREFLSEGEQTEGLGIEVSVGLLAQAFSNLSRYSKLQHLPKLILETVNARQEIHDLKKEQSHSYLCGYTPLHVHRTTGDLHKRVFRALTASPLPITCLSIIGVHNRQKRPKSMHLDDCRFVFGCDGLVSVIGNTLLPSPATKDLSGGTQEKMEAIVDGPENIQDASEAITNSALASVDASSTNDVPSKTIKADDQSLPAIIMPASDHYLAVAPLPPQDCEGVSTQSPHTTEVLCGSTQVQANFNLVASLSTIRELSIEFSASSRSLAKDEHEEDEMDSDREPVGPAATKKRDWWPVLSICHLIKLCPGLEMLRLKGFDAWSVLEVSLLQQIMDSCPLQSLKECHLEGFGTRRGELLSFLRHHPILEKLTMIALFETNEGYVNLFDHIANKMHQLQSLLIDNMWERKLHGDRDDEEGRREMVSLCYFQGKGRQHYPHSRMTGTNIIEQEEYEIREVIVNKLFLGGRPIGSGKLYTYRPAWAKNYGSFPAQM